MKRICTLGLLVSLFASLCLFMGCTGTTPDDAAESETAITLEEMDWKFTVEINGGETKTYTYAEAKTHPLAKTICSYRYGADRDNPQVTSSIFEGCLFSEFLADIGCSDATKVEIYHTNTKYYTKAFEFAPEVFNDPKTVLCWIQNKKDVIQGSASHVGFAAEKGGVNDMCTSIDRIVIYK